MKEFLDTLRQKPRHAKQRIAFFTTLSIFALIFNVWWLSWTSPVDSEQAVSVGDVVSPLGVVAHMFADAKDGTERMVTGLVGQMQYHASDTLAATAASGDASTQASDIVYPEQVFGENFADRFPDTPATDTPELTQ